MLRKWATAIAVATAIGTPAVALAQPPSPPEIVHKVDRGVRRTFTHMDRTIRGHATRRSVRHTTRRSVRALCNDGRVHIGRTPASACVGHGGRR